MQCTLFVLENVSTKKIGGSNTSMILSKKQQRYLQSLSRKKVREEEKKFLVEGWRMLEEALHSNFIIEYVVVTKKALNSHHSVLEEFQRRSIPLYELSENEIASIASTEHSQGILALVHQKQWTLDDSARDTHEFLVACDAISDPGNLGTIIRTCDWFGVDCVLLGKGCVSLYNEKVVRSTMGSLFHLPIVEDVDLPTVLRELQRKSWKVFATALDGAPIAKHLPFPSKTILVFGNEAHGIQSAVYELADIIVAIPRYGRAESLNVSAACSAFLMAWRSRQR